MPSLRDIRKRIQSVKNTQQITKVMKMVSAAKLRRAQDNIVSARPYARHLHQVLSALAARQSGALQGEEVHPLLAQPPARKIELIVVTSDRGLCGGFNTNIIRRTERFLREHGADYEEINVSTIGRKGRDYFRRRRALRREHEEIFSALSYEKAREIGEGVIESFVGSELDEVHLIYNEFKSVMQQRVVMERLLPITPLDVPEDRTLIDYLYEASRESVLERLLPLHIYVQLYRLLLESTAAEHGARMTAMDAATTNAAEMVDKLTLQFNRARQAAITKELMEIIGGKEALAS